MDKKRPVGRPKGSGKGRTVKTFSVSMTPARISKLDRIKGDKTRSAFIGDKIDKHKER
jgi:hypothetical protein